ncbi:hypothetical protein GCM10022415_15700 [Knoellia locipacati]|uniref:PIN domain-containing protein n=1 Tax=Knoellia locipacati TaxID=882824 RepID=A0A512T055_9MICO|nr:hypothetical protein [Knoellia locipacati]GEQ13520.1 hypothetical protein KLO01_15670 [Knoellia locipacati]
MSRFFFADNTVLVNFGILDRLELLGKLLNDKGRWCATVAQECDASAGVEGLGVLGKAGAVFGEPERPTPAELIDTRVLRDRMASPGDHRFAHLGEAETVAIMTRRFATSYFVTDDVGAATIAAAEGLRVLNTWDLLRALVRSGLLAREDLWTDLEALTSAGRGRPPGVYGYKSFRTWVDPA